MIEDEQLERAAGTKRKRPSKATRSKQKRLVSPIKEAAQAPAPMITRSKSIPKDDSSIF
ncbi:recombination-associated protein RdgC [Sesbania bispinosa]|nr:recombination-associated protein RdgC [Sesbania bispinosa]